jgi:hypothetical protein
MELVKSEYNFDYNKNKERKLNFKKKNNSTLSTKEETHLLGTSKD